MLPKINQEYHYFDDGKISAFRHSTVIIKEIIPFNEISEEKKEKWLENIRWTSWLYNKTTDYFIIGQLQESQVNVMFVRTLENDWFSIGWNAGRLDVDGSLFTAMPEHMKNKIKTKKMLR